MKMFLINIMKFGKKFSNIIKKEFNSELIYYKKYLKAKKIDPKEKVHCACAQLILTYTYANDDSDDSDHSDEEITDSKIRMKKIKCINLLKKYQEKKW